MVEEQILLPGEAAPERIVARRVEVGGSAAWYALPGFEIVGDVLPPEEIAFVRADVYDRVVAEAARLRGPGRPTPAGWINLPPREWAEDD